MDRRFTRVKVQASDSTQCQCLQCFYQCYQIGHLNNALQAPLHVGLGSGNQKESLLCFQAYFGYTVLNTFLQDGQ